MTKSCQQKCLKNKINLQKNSSSTFKINDTKIYLWSSEKLAEKSK